VCRQTRAPRGGAEPRGRVWGLPVLKVPSWSDLRAEETNSVTDGDARLRQTKDLTQSGPATRTEERAGTFAAPRTFSLSWDTSGRGDGVVVPLGRLPPESRSGWLRGDRRPGRLAGVLVRRKLRQLPARDGDWSRGAGRRSPDR
jgi:hypothetical protein